jgi:hypothetical protein
VLKKDVSEGRHYAVAHTSYTRLSVVRIDRAFPNGYQCTKLSTGRRIWIKSAAKFRFEVARNPQGNPNSTAKWVRV